MGPRLRFLLVGLILIFTLSQSFAQGTDARSESQLGIDAYQKGDYREAVRHLRRATFLDSSSALTHLRLADAYDAMYCETCEFDPGPAAKANDHWRLQAISEYKATLQLDPSNTEALDSLGHRYYRDADFDDAERYYRRAIEIDSASVEALYTLGVIDWERSRRARAEKQVALNIDPQKSIIGSPACAELREHSLPRINEGLELLHRALQLTNAGDVMEYTSLLYREHAETNCNDPTAYEDDLKTSASWGLQACRNRQSSQPSSLRWPAAPPPSDRVADLCVNEKEP